MLPYTGADTSKSNGMLCFETNSFSRFGPKSINNDIFLLAPSLVLAYRSSRLHDTSLARRVFFFCKEEKKLCNRPLFLWLSLSESTSPYFDQCFVLLFILLSNAMCRCVRRVRYSTFALSCTLVVCSFISCRFMVIFRLPVSIVFIYCHFVFNAQTKQY